MAVHQHRYPEEAEGGASSLPMWTTHHSDHFQAFADESDSTLNGLRPFHPAYVIPQAAVHLMREWARSHGVLQRGSDGEIKE